MGHGRVYENKIKINAEKVKDFYEHRAEMLDEKGYSVVLLNDEKPETVAASNEYDRNVILPEFRLNGKMRVLDIGCGIGRWAEMILPHCGFYCGTDFSEMMIEKAKERLSSCFPAEKYSLYVMSAQETVEKDIAFYGGSFDLIIITGVCMYINDDELLKIFKKIPELCSKEAKIYIKDPAAIETRLTLDNVASYALKSDYSAIYRTPKEYCEFHAPLLEAGFSVIKSGFIEQIKRKRAETDAWHIFYKR